MKLSPIEVQGVTDEFSNSIFWEKIFNTFLDIKWFSAVGVLKDTLNTNDCEKRKSS